MKCVTDILRHTGAVFAVLLTATSVSWADDCSDYLKWITTWIEQTPDNSGKCHMENVPDDSEYPDHSIPYKLRNDKEFCPKHRSQMDWEYLWKNGRRISGVRYFGSEVRMTLAFKESFIPDGPVRIFRDEKLFCEVPINGKGKPDGILREFSPEGKLTHGFCMADGKRVGSFVKFDENGRLHSFACGDKPIFDGDVERCGFNGKPAVVKLPNGKTLTHLKGKLTMEESVNSNGARTVKKYAFSDKGTETVLITEYFKNGNLYQSYSKRDGNLEGEFRELYDDGSTAEEGIAEQGRIIEIRKFFRNGKPKLEARLNKTGDLCEARIFTPEGMPDREGTFKSSRKSVAWVVPHGKVRNYFHDGTLLDEGKYLDGSRDGSHTYYLKEGKKEEIDYVKGKPLRVREFDDKGVLVKESEIYEDGSKRTIRDH
jgi:antitoxin component YwqK of YwqJK toxin-antitoxin module